MASLGQHLAVDMYGCRVEKLTDLEFIKEAMYAAIKEADMTLLNISHQIFETEGLTACALLSESHMTIHTNPSLGYMSIDIFTLNKNCQPDKAVQALRRFIKPDKTKTTLIMRGDFGSLKDMKPKVRVNITPIRRIKNTGSRVLRFLARKS
jgi:S-adenosylmethionine decarboxylase